MCGCVLSPTISPARRMRSLKYACMAMYGNRLGRCVSQFDVHSTRRHLHTIVTAAHSARLCNLPWRHGIVPPTMVGLISNTRIFFVTSVEDYVDTSSECDRPPDECGVHCKAQALEHDWVGNAKVSATACRTLTKSASTLFGCLSISP